MTADGPGRSRGQLGVLELVGEAGREIGRAGRRAGEDGAERGGAGAAGVRARARPGGGRAHHRHDALQQGEFGGAGGAAEAQQRQRAAPQLGPAGAFLGREAVAGADAERRRAAPGVPAGVEVVQENGPGPAVESVQRQPARIVGTPGAGRVAVHLDGRPARGAHDQPVAVTGEFGGGTVGSCVAQGAEGGQRDAPVADGGAGGEGDTGPDGRGGGERAEGGQVAGGGRVVALFEAADAAFGPGAGEGVEQDAAGGAGGGALGGLQQGGVLAGEPGGRVGGGGERVEEHADQEQPPGVLAVGEDGQDGRLALGAAEFAELGLGGRGGHATAPPPNSPVTAAAMCRMSRWRSAQYTEGLRKPCPSR